MEWGRYKGCALLPLLAVVGLWGLVSLFMPGESCFVDMLSPPQSNWLGCVSSQKDECPPLFWSLCFPTLCSAPSVCLQLAHLTNLVVPSFSPSFPTLLPFSHLNLSPPLPSLLVSAGPSAAARSVFSKLLPPSSLASLSTPAVQPGINPISSSALSLLYSRAVFVLYELLLIRYVADKPGGFGVSWRLWGQGSGIPEAVGPIGAGQ